MAKKQIDWYESTNRTLFKLLEQGIANEKKHVLDLSRRESQLKSKISSEEKRIDKTNLSAKKGQLTVRLNALKASSKSIKSELGKNQRRLASTQKEAESLKGLLQKEGDNEEKVEKDIIARTKVLLNKKRTEIKLIKQQRTQIVQQLDRTKKERNLLAQEIDSAHKAVSGKSSAGILFADLITAAGKKIAEYEKDLVRIEEETAKRNDLVEKSVGRTESDITNLKKERVQLLSQIKEQENKLADLNFLEKQKREKEKQVASQLKNIKTIRDALQESKSDFSTVKSKLSSEKDKIHDYGDSAKLLRQATRKSLTSIMATSEREREMASKKQTAISERIKSLEKKKITMWTTLERDKNSLNNIKDELYVLEQGLQQRQQIDTTKEKMIVMEIDSLRREISMGNAKIKKVDVLLKRISNISLEGPNLVTNIKQEKMHLKNRQLETSKTIVSKEQEVKTLHKIFFQFKKSFAVKRKNIESMQANLLSEQKKHKDHLATLSTALESLQKELMVWAGKVRSVESSRQRKVLQRESFLRKKITQINSSIAQIKDFYQKDSRHLSDVQKRMAKLHKDLSTLEPRLSRQEKTLNLFNQRIKVEHSKRDDLEERQKYLLSLKQKIVEESKQLENLKSKKLNTLQRAEQNYALVMGRMDKYLADVQGRISTLGDKKLKTIDAKITQIRNTYDRLYEKVKLRRQQTDAKIKELSKQASLNKKEIHHKLKLLRVRKVSAGRKIQQLRKKIRNLIDRQEKTLHQLDHLTNERQRISEVFETKNKHVDELENVIREKVSSSEKLRKLRQELQQVRAVINGRIMKLERSGKTSKAKKISKKNKKVGKKAKVSPKVKIVKKVVVRDLSAKQKREISTLMKKMDLLLGKLPQKEIDAFAKSADFEIYKKVMEQYGIN